MVTTAVLPLLGGRGSIMKSAAISEPEKQTNLPWHGPGAKVILQEGIRRKRNWGAAQIRPRSVISIHGRRLMSQEVPRKTTRGEKAGIEPANGRTPSQETRLHHVQPI